jgi:hypothetical protein
MGAADGHHLRFCPGEKNAFPARDFIIYRYRPGGINLYADYTDLADYAEK